MWTHRLFDGRRVYINHRGISTLTGDGTVKLHLDQGPYVPELDDMGILTKDEISKISRILDLNLDTGKDVRMQKLKSISVNADWGIKGQPNSVFQGKKPYVGLLYNNIDSSRGDVAQGPAGVMLRPRAHSINWQLSKLSTENKETSQTYKIANTSLQIQLIMRPCP